MVTFTFVEWTIYKCGAWAVTVFPHIKRMDTMVESITFKTQWKAKGVLYGFVNYSRN